MNILILTVTAGHGHNQTAKSIYNYATAKGHNALILDSLEYINPLLKDTVNKAYLLSTSLSPKAYGKVYSLIENKDINDSLISGQNITTTLLSKKIIKFIKDFKPDAIICTHVFSATFVSDIKKEGIDALTFGIVTDYTLHPFWNETNIDYYVLPNEYLTYQTVSKGIPEEKILPFGIPIDSKFNKKLDKKLARELVGIDNKPTILMMSGSMGYGNMFMQLEAICNLPYDFQIVSICGNNKSTKKKIDSHTFPKKVYNIGFSDKVDIYMDACDIIITKPGGLTVSEALAKKIPMILTNPIPGHEARNREFLINMGVAMTNSKTYPIEEVVAQILTSPKKLQTMENAIDLIRKPEASKTLIEFIEEIKND